MAEDDLSSRIRNCDGYSEQAMASPRWTHWMKGFSFYVNEQGLLIEEFVDGDNRDNVATKTSETMKTYLTNAFSKTFGTRNFCNTARDRYGDGPQSNGDSFKWLLRTPSEHLSLKASISKSRKFLTIYQISPKTTHADQTMHIPSQLVTLRLAKLDFTLEEYC